MRVTHDRDRPFNHRTRTACRFLAPCCLWVSSFRHQMGRADPTGNHRTAVCDVMRSASADFAGLKSALAALKLIILDNSSATFALEQSGFCKLDSGEPTGSPTEFSLEVVGWRKWAGAPRTCARKTDPIPSSPGARALAQIRQASDLTIEALAPLIGVSRRTLHNWLAGGEISQRNEERLRALAEAVEQIAAVGPEDCSRTIDGTCAGVAADIRSTCGRALRNRNRARNGR